MRAVFSLNVPLARRSKSSATQGNFICISVDQCFKMCWTSIMAPSFSFSVPWLHFTLYYIHSTMALLAWLYLTLHHDFTWLYLSVLHSTIAQLGSTCLHYPLPWLNILGSILVPTWLYYTLLQSTMSLLGSTWPNFTVLHSAMVLLSSILDST